MISLACIVPHPPILVPQIGKDNISKLAKTALSFEKLSDYLSETKPTTIIVVSPHGNIQSDFFTINMAPVLKANFEEFGDFSTKLSWTGSPLLASEIREYLANSTNVQLISEPNLDHGTAVPLSLLTGVINPKILPLYYSGLSKQEHYDFGVILGEIINNSNENIAIIASGDLSHSLSKNSPAGYSPQGKKFDQKLIQYLKEQKIEKIINFDDILVKKAAECGLNSILILAGMLKNSWCTPRMLSYEAPFGVGYLVMQMI